MIDPVRRAVRWIGSAIVLAAVPMAAFSATEAAAQAPPAAIPGMPNMGEAYPLTPELVAAWVESFPAVYTLSQNLAEEFNVPEGETPAAGLAAYATVTGAMGQMTGAVSEYGFTDYGQWINVMFSVLTAYALASEDIPPEAAAMMLATFGQTRENIDAVAANLDAVAALVDDL